MKLHKGDWCGVESDGRAKEIVVDAYRWEQGCERRPRQQVARPFPGCHPTPDSAGTFYAADDPRRPF